MSNFSSPGFSEEELDDSDALADLEAEELPPDSSATKPEYEENDDPDYDPANDEADGNEPWEMGERP